MTRVFDYWRLPAACLVPQVCSAERVGIDVTSWPQIARAVAGLRDRPAFAAAHPVQSRFA